MTIQLKPGTRCECRDYDCARMDVESDHHRTFPEDQCENPAVRLVTVQGPTPSTYMREHAENYAKQVPMCAACAEYAEYRHPKCDDPGAHRPGCQCDGGEPLL
jgi:hypothetical protein